MKATLQEWILCFLAAVVGVAASYDGQQPLNHAKLQHVKESDLIYELKIAEIIPTVIDEFKPFLTVNISWDNATADVGNTINPADTQDTPKINLIDSLPELWTKDKIPQLTLAVTDPDAPSRDNPEWSEMCHWIATDVQLIKSDESNSGAMVMKSLTNIMPYKPPGPPPKTGKHRYVFVALAPKNGTTEALHLSKPGDRQHWGYKHERDGLRKWAEDNGLGIVGANFIYEQNDKQ